MATSGNIRGKRMGSKQQNVYFPVVFFLEAKLKDFSLIQHPERLPWWDLGSQGVFAFLPKTRLKNLVKLDCK